MTRLSREGMPNTWKLRDLPTVARFSLLALCVTFLGNPSCLLTTSTEFPEPVPSPPFLDANTALATPLGFVGVPITKILSVDDETGEVTLSADVRSDDVGRELSAYAYVNYRTTSDPANPYLRVGGGDILPPSAFDDVRRISASFFPNTIPDGCYQVALVVSHEFDRKRFLPVNEEDSALLVWWMVKGDPAGISLTQCPTVSPSANQDAGVEGGT